LWICGDLTIRAIRVVARVLRDASLADGSRAAGEVAGSDDRLLSL
jgi:hypothetical protein